jgi:peptide/nickel transport system permease protein
MRVSTLEPPGPSGPGRTQALPGARVRRRRGWFARLVRTPMSLLGLVIILGLGALAVFAPLLATHDPRLVDLASQFLPPGPDHWFGTDSAGQDVYSRVVFGSRLALGSGLLVLLLATLAGSLIGIVAGYRGGWVDEIVMRVTDMFLAFPGLIIAMAVVAAIQQRSLWAIVIAISVRWWTPYARLMRAEALSVRSRDYVHAARALGASTPRIVFTHILPNTLAAVVIQATLDLGYIILTAASLSFIGFGAQPGEADWGRMVSEGREYMRTNPWIIAFPGAAIFVTVLGFNLVGDGLRDVLDPRLD